MTRRKSPALAAPQTLEEAMALLNRYAAIAAAVAQVDVDRDAALAEINGAADKMTAPYEAELQSIVKQLKPWWAVARDELTGGKRKSIELGGCMIGYRMSTPRLVFEGGAINKDNEGRATDLLRTSTLGQYTRVTIEVDKPSVLSTLADPGHNAHAELGQLGFARKQTETFFVDRLPPAPKPVMTVPDDDPAEGMQ